jgi:hypothetical protein
MQQKVEEMNREQERTKMTREKLAEENQIGEKIEMIRARSVSERGGYGMV